MSDQHINELALALGELAASAMHPSRDDAGVPRVCPVCGKTMELLKQFDLTIDVCADHGVWLDQGELAVLLERTYWYRREEEQHSNRRDLSNEIDRTRERFKTSLNRVAGLIGI